GGGDYARVDRQHGATKCARAHGASFLRALVPLSRRRPQPGIVLHPAVDAGRAGRDPGTIVRARQPDSSAAAAAEVDHPERRDVDLQDLRALEELSFFNPDY